MGYIIYVRKTDYTQIGEEMEKGKYSVDWAGHIAAAHSELVEQENTRELGKIRQHANEHAVQNWLLHEGFRVFRHEEMTEEQFGTLDHNCSGWDMVEPSSGLRIQAKYRGGKNENGRWHMEQTRRTTGANVSKSDNGQVRYEDNEFDMMVFTSPPSVSDTFSSDDLIAIPVSELRDPKKPGFLVGRVSPALVNKWRNRQPIDVISEAISHKLSDNA